MPPRSTPGCCWASLHEIDEVEANVSQRLSRHRVPAVGPGSERHRPRRGQRPATDYAAGDACTGGNCDRRAAYLEAATDLLVSDLRRWSATGGDGAARAALAADGEPKGLAMMLTGMGSLSYGELAGERIKLGLMLHDPEEEHDCFSDNTHNSHYLRRGRHAGRLSRPLPAQRWRVVEGRACPTSCVGRSRGRRRDARGTRQDPGGVHGDQADRRQPARWPTTRCWPRATRPANAMIQAGVDALVAQTRSIERVVAALGCGPARVRGVRQPRQPRGGLPVSALVAMLARLAGVRTARCTRELRQARNTALLAQLAGGEGQDRHG